MQMPKDGGGVWLTPSRSAPARYLRGTTPEEIHVSNIDQAKHIDQTDEAQLAAVLGLSPAALSELDYVVEKQHNSEGSVTGYIVRFSEGAPHPLLNTIPGLQDGRWVEVGAHAFDLPDDYA
jgi:hypothetical protein